MSNTYSTGPAYYVRDLVEDQDLQDNDIAAAYIQEEKVPRGVLASIIADFVGLNTNPDNYFRSITTINDLTTADTDVYDLVTANDVWLRINNAGAPAIGVTVNLPENRQDGQKVSISPVAALVGDITVTVVPFSGDSINQASVTLTALDNNTENFTFSEATQTWYLSGV